MPPRLPPRLPPLAAPKARVDDSAAATALAVEACAEAHRRLGPGLPREIYSAALGHELSSRHIPFQRHVSLPIFYRGVRLDAAYAIDVCVSAQVIVEVRTVETITRAHRAELRSKLRASGLNVGIIVNFHAARFGQGLVILRRSRPAVRLLEQLALLDQPTLAGGESNDESRTRSSA